MNPAVSFHRVEQLDLWDQPLDLAVEVVEPGVGVTISSLVLVRPMEVVIERVALPPVSSTLWKISNSPVNSSLILLQISELSGARIGTQFGCPLTTVVNCHIFNVCLFVGPASVTSHLISTI